MCCRLEFNDYLSRSDLGFGESSFFGGEKITSLISDQLQIIIRVLFLCALEKIRFVACLLGVGTELSPEI